jgi:hypothetical protein
MKKHIRILLLGVIALLALGTLPACSSGTSTQETKASETSTSAAPATPAPFPQSAKYIADTKSPDGKPMVIGIAVDGTDIAAYACNGTDDEAWFFGDQKEGKINITSRFKDTLSAEFNGGVSGRDFEQAELQQLNELQFRNSVRNKRQLQQAQQITLLANKSAKSTINGHEVTPVIVDGNFRL